MIKTYAFKIMDERMYVVFEEGCDTAVVIDPSDQEEAYEDIKNAGVSKLVIFLTHHHFDHICGVNDLRGQFDCQVICTDTCGKVICSENNGSRQFPFLFMTDKEMFYYIRDRYEFPYTCTADITFEDRMSMSVIGHEFELLEMPGHSRTCMMVMMDNKILFTGDNVIGNGQELVFKDACKDEYRTLVIPYLESLEDTDVKIMPGHGEDGSVKHFLELIHGYDL